MRADSAGVESAGALDDPMAMVQLWNLPVDLSTVPVMVNVTQTVPLGGKRAARRDEADAMAAASRAELTTESRDVAAQVAKAYFDLFLADRTIEVDDEIAGTLRSLVSAAAARLSAARGEQSEVLRAQSEELKVESDREAARARRAAAVAKLVALLDRPAGSNLGRTSDPGLLTDLPADRSAAGAGPAAAARAGRRAGAHRRRRGPGTRGPGRRRPGSGALGRRDARVPQRDVAGRLPVPGRAGQPAGVRRQEPRARGRRGRRAGGGAGAGPGHRDGRSWRTSRMRWPR